MSQQWQKKGQYNGYSGWDRNRYGNGGNGGNYGNGGGGGYGRRQHNGSSGSSGGTSSFIDMANNLNDTMSGLKALCDLTKFATAVTTMDNGGTVGAQQARQFDRQEAPQQPHPPPQLHQQARTWQEAATSTPSSTHGLAEVIVDASADVKQRDAVKDLVKHKTQQERSDDWSSGVEDRIKKLEKDMLETKSDISGIKDKQCADSLVLQEILGACKSLAKRPTEMAGQDRNPRR
eukprot:TRINITY_DN44529_c0_g1_i1.p1 TRINITY_DN44529_c0_g1~~TRINITY_DN44529_c0_g1_i1.p1  ORF type:complete len:247 (-),score=56.50 TRINITY_DN44529_c0_g1_i1:1049-1747(-)